jgi:large subunit ribosomal protein L14
MIIVQTTVQVVDNSGAKKAKCIRVLGGTRKKYASIGDIIKVSVKEVVPNTKVKKGSVFSALVVRTKYGLRRLDVILLDESRQFLGTRVFGGVSRELKRSFPKVVSLAQYVF